MRKKVKIHIRGFSERVREELENAEIEILIRKRGKPRNSDWDEGKIILVAKKRKTMRSRRREGPGLVRQHIIVIFQLRSCLIRNITGIE